MRSWKATRCCLLLCWLFTAPAARSALPPSLHARPDLPAAAVPAAEATLAGAAGFWGRVQRLEPVVFEGAAAGWPAAEWRAASVAAKLGGAQIRVENTARQAPGWDASEAETAAAGTRADDFLLGRGQDRTSRRLAVGGEVIKCRPLTARAQRYIRL